MTPAEWLDQVAAYGDLWPHAQLPPGTVRAWWPLLSDLDAADVSAALSSCAVQPGRRFPPGVGEIREAAGPPVPGWEAALAELAAQIRRCGVYGAPVLEGALAAVVASYGGWLRLCETFDAGDTTARAQFRDAWRSASQAAGHRRLAQLPAAPVGELQAGDRR